MFEFKSYINYKYIFIFVSLQIMNVKQIINMSMNINKIIYHHNINQTQLNATL